MISPFRWHGVVETRNFFETVPVNSLTPDIDMESGILFYKPPVTPQLEAAKASHLGRVYLDWAAFPFTRQTTLEGGAGYLVDFQDLRYTYPGSRGAPLGAFVLLSPDNHVLDQGMNSSRPASLEH
jgi:inner membrane protein